jgi:transposase-like protein
MTGLSMEQVAQRYGVGHTTIETLLIKAGCERRSHTESAAKRYAHPRKELAEAEREVLELRENLRRAEERASQARAKLGRPRTAQEDAARYRPRILELRADGKSWGQVQRIMNTETGENRSASGWRHILEDSSGLIP